jgi:hypothetical protein
MSFKEIYLNPCECLYSDPIGKGQYSVLRGDVNNIVPEQLFFTHMLLTERILGTLWYITSRYLALSNSSQNIY